MESLRSDVEDESYAAVLSYSEAIKGLDAGNTSWALVKLYYSAFYCIRAALLADGIVPFHCNDFYLCDTRDGTVKKGGKSSHQWHWKSIRDFRRLTGWFYSDESDEAYLKLRNAREDANYRLGFGDPSWPSCLAEVLNAGIVRSFRTYRDDSSFFYTYLDDHLAFAYPTRLIISIENNLVRCGFNLSQERQVHLKRVWPLKERPPLVALS